MITKRYVRDSTFALGPIEEQSRCSSTSDETLTLTSDASPLSFRTSSWDGESYDNVAQKTSCYSFQEDKFDRLASDDVLHMFEAIDSELYEDDVTDESSHKSRPKVARDRRHFEKSRERRFASNSVAPSIASGQQLQRECISELKTAFPHFRICGTSVVAASDDGVQIYNGRTTSAKSQASTNQEHNSFGRQGLTVMGRNVESSCPQTSSGSLHLSNEEEIFEIDGKMEETIAVDYRNCEEITHRSNTLQWGSGIPPVTPLGCIRSNIMDSVFDEAWKEVVFQIQKCLCFHILESSQMGLSKARLTTASSSSRQRPRSPAFEEQPESSTSNLEKPIRTIRRDQYALTSLLRIQPKTLTTREKLEPNMLSLSSVNTSSPSTSDIIFLQVTGNSSRLGEPLTSPGRRNVIKERLEAIHDNDDGPSTPSMRFEIRGHGLPFSTRIEPLSSLSFLPPIGSELQRMTSSVSSSSHLGGNKTPATLKRPAYRVNSAFVPNSQRFLPERPATQSTLRPVTGGTSKLENSAISMHTRRFSSTQSANKRSICLLESAIAPSGSSGQPHVRGIALQRYHTVIS